MFVNRKERRRKGMRESAIIWYMGKTSSLPGNTRERGDEEERKKRGIGPRRGCSRGRVDHFISLKNVDENGWKRICRVFFYFLFRLNIELSLISSTLTSCRISFQSFIIRVVFISNFRWKRTVQMTQNLRSLTFVLCLSDRAVTSCVTGEHTQLSPI